MSIRYGQFDKRSCRGYVAYDDVSYKGVVIDPVIDCVDDYLEMFRQWGIQLTHVVDTHHHADHLSGGAMLKERTGCEYLMHRSSNVSAVTSYLDEGRCCIGDIPVQVMHTPGHTKDSITLILLDGLILVGDLLFLDEGGAGRLDLPGGDAGEHWDSLQRILGLPDDLIICPAHDYRNCSPSTIAVQKIRNQFLAPRTRDEYRAFTNKLRYGPAEWMKDVLRLNEECSLPAMLAYTPPSVANACENVCEGGMPVDSSTSVPYISAQELNAQLASSFVPILLDVRENEELTSELAALPGIIHISVGRIGECMQELNAYREKPIVVICRSGVRAARVASALMEAGFPHVSVLSGGMLAWREWEKQD